MARDALHIMLDELPCAAFIVGRDGRVRSVNARAGELLGTDPDQLLDRDVLELYAEIPEGRPRARRLRERFREGHPIQGELLALQRTDGGVVWGQLWVEPIADATGRAHESRSLVFDVTARHQAEQARRQHERRFRAAFTDAPIGAALLDRYGLVVAANGALARLLRRDEPALSGWELATLFDHDQAGRLRAMLLAGRPSSIGEIPLDTRGGNEVWVRVSLAPLAGDTSDDARFIVHLEDVTAARQLREQLERAAVRDPLTGLFNRRGFVERGRELLAAADRAHRPVALLFLDVDGLKQINDRAGHGAGDQALVATAASLRGRFRTEDPIGRWGGDEFCVLLDDTDGGAVRTIVAQWDPAGSRSAAALPRLSLGASVRLPGSGMRVEQLIDAADAAMYADRDHRRAAPRPT